MKRILLALIAITISSGVFAQSASTNKKLFPPDIHKTNDGMNQNTRDNIDSIINPNKMDKHPDGYMMDNGKMVMVKDGEIYNMEKDVTLTNGLIIMVSGHYIKKGGTKIMLKDGEHIDMTGKIFYMKTKIPNE